MLQLLRTHSGKVTYLWNIFTNMEKFNLSDIWLTYWHRETILQAVWIWLFSHILVVGSYRNVSQQWCGLASISHPISIAHSYSGELKVCVLWPLSPLHPFLSPWPMWPICSCLKMFILCRTITTSYQFVLCCWDGHCNHFISVFTTIPSIFNTILTNIQMFVHQA